jgi:hypothetical protein
LWGCEQVWSCWGQRTVSGCFEHGDEWSYSTNIMVLADRLSNCWPQVS